MVITLMSTVQIIAVIFGFLLLAIVGRSLVKLFRIRRFHHVKRGVMLRGGQPNTQALWFLKTIFGIRTVINLREDFKENEKLFGMSEHRILIPPRTNIPTMDQVREFFDIVDKPENQPILVHCKVGANRTGIMVASYRIHREGWTFDLALDEMKRISRREVREHAVACLKEISEQEFPVLKENQRDLA